MHRVKVQTNEANITTAAMVLANSPPQKKKKKKKKKKTKHQHEGLKLKQLLIVKRTCHFTIQLVNSPVESFAPTRRGESVTPWPATRHWPFTSPTSMISDRSSHTTQPTPSLYRKGWVQTRNVSAKGTSWSKYFFVITVLKLRKDYMSTKL